MSLHGEGGRRRPRAPYAGREPGAPRGRRAPEEAEEMDAELHDQAERDQRARHVRDPPARVAHDLQHRGAVVVGIARLVEGAAAEAQRIVHEDPHLAVVAAVVAAQADGAREVPRDVGSRIDVVGELEQGDRERQVVALGAEGEPPGPPLVRERLRLLAASSRRGRCRGALRARQLDEARSASWTRPAWSSPASASPRCRRPPRPSRCSGGASGPASASAAWRSDSRPRASRGTAASDAGSGRRRSAARTGWRPLRRSRDGWSR